VGERSPIVQRSRVVSLDEEHSAKDQVPCKLTEMYALLLPSLEMRGLSSVWRRLRAPGSSQGRSVEFHWGEEVRTLLGRPGADLVPTRAGIGGQS
jgi:hypothetical protein